MPKDFTIRPDLDLTDIKRKLASLSRTPTTLKLDTKGFKPLGKITGELGEFEKSLAASNARVIAFGASTTVIMGIQRAFSALIRTTIDVEKQLTDINVIMNESTSGIAKFGKELFKVAGQTGQNFATIATAATELARQGLSAEEVLLRVKDAMILTRLSGLGAVESVSALTAAINSFNKVAVTSTELINKMANVDAAFAVSAGDLAKAISRVGSSAQSAGVDLDQLMAIVTSAQQTTARGGAVIGNSFKTIFTRIQRPRVIKELEKLGIAVRGFSGDMLPAMDVLNNMAKSFDLLSRAQRAQISELVGGVFQVNILKAAMADLNKETSIYSRALGISAGSTDQAIRRNTELNKTLAATLNETVANFQSVGSEIGKLSLEPAIRKVLGLTNKALKAGADPKQGEDVGATMGSAIFKGLGDFLKGPGLAIGGVALVKIFTRIILFSKDAFQTIVGVGQAAGQAAAQNAKVLQLLQKQPDLVRQVAERTMTLKQAHDQVISALTTETEALRTMDVLAKDVASTLSSVGLGISDLGLVSVAGGKKGGRKKAAGHVPNAVAETIGAVVGGYTPGRIAQTNIRGLGRVTYNTAETIKQFPGFAQPAIMPPERSRAGKNYRQTFSGKHGFNPYANAGIVPNFASPVKIKPGQSVSYGGKTISIGEAKIIVKKMDMNPRPGRSSDERTQKMLSALRSGKTSGGRYNNDSSMALLLTNSGLGKSYNSALKGKADAAAAKSAQVEAKKIRQASAPRLNTVLMRNLEQVGTNVHGVARYGMNKNMMPDARGRFQSSFEKRYKQMMDSLADDMFSQGGAGKMKDKLMSQYSAQGLDKNAKPQVMGRVWESFLQGMGSPVDPRLATSGMARKDFSNYKMKPAFRELFTPGPATQMGFTGGEARLSGISSKKAYEKMGIDPRLYMSDGFVPNFGLGFTRKGSRYNIHGSFADIKRIAPSSKKYMHESRYMPYLEDTDMFSLLTDVKQAGSVGFTGKDQHRLLEKKGAKQFGMVAAGKGKATSGTMQDVTIKKLHPAVSDYLSSQSATPMAKQQMKALAVSGGLEGPKFKSFTLNGFNKWIALQKTTRGRGRGGSTLASYQKRGIIDDKGKLTSLLTTRQLSKGDSQGFPIDLLPRQGSYYGGGDTKNWASFYGWSPRKKKGFERLKGTDPSAGFANTGNIDSFYKATIGKQARFMLEMGKIGAGGSGKSPRSLNEAVQSEIDSIDLGRYVLGVNKNHNPYLPTSSKKTRGRGSAGYPSARFSSLSGGFIPNLMRRRVFDIDAYKQKYAGAPDLLQQRLGITKTSNLKELFDYDVMRAGQKGHLTVVNAAAGAGKTTFAVGNKGQIAYNSNGVRSGDRSVVVRASETMTAGAGGLFNKSYTPYVDKYISLLPPGGAVREGRRSRNTSGQYMFGRKGGQTAGASTDFTAPAAVIQSMVGGKHRALARGLGANQRWGSAGALPNVHTLPVAAVSGAFSPFHMGHQKVLDAAQKSGLPTIVHVAAGKNRKHDIGLSVGRKSSLIREGNPGVAVASGSNLPENFKAPRDMVVKVGGQTHNIKKGDVIQATAEGSKLFVGSDRMSKSGVRGIFSQVEVPRGTRGMSGMSATEVRGDIMRGDTAALSKKLPGNWNKFISSNLGDIQRQQGMMAGREAKKLAVINEEKARLWGKMGVPYDPYGRNPALNKKRVAEYPKETARIAELNAESKKAVGHKWRKRVFPNLSGGYVPNFRTSSMNDALKRSAIAETAAGQGNVRFGLDPRLSASGNPLGIGTYNTSEGSLSKAIAMHRGSGVNVQELRSLGKDQQRGAGGIIPNFADPVSVLKSMERFLLANSGQTMATGTGAFGKGSRKATRLEVWSSDRQIRKEAKAMSKEMGGGGGSALGMGLMFGGPMVAQMATRVLEQQGAIGGRTAAGVGGALTGASTGAMLGAFLPGKFKMLAAPFAILGGVVETSASTFEYDMKELASAAQKTLADFQKMSNASAKYVEATEAFEAAITDSKVTARTLTRLSRESNKQLALLSPEVRGKIAQGVSPEERREIVMEAVTAGQGKVEQAGIGARLSKEKLLGSEALGKQGWLGILGRPELDRAATDKLRGEGQAIAFGMEDFDKMVKAVAKGGEGALGNFGFSSGTPTVAGIDKLQEKGVLEETLAGRMKEALEAGATETVDVIIKTMKETVKLEAETRRIMEQITIAKERENKELNKLRKSFEEFKVGQETARKLTDLDLKAGARSGKRFLSARGQANFGFESAQLENFRKSKNAVGTLQFGASEGIRRGDIATPTGSSAQISALLRPQNINKQFSDKLTRQINQLNRTPEDAKINKDILTALINIRDKTDTSLNEQKQQTEINKKIRDLQIQEAREQQNLAIGGGIESFMNIDSQNSRFEKLNKASMQQRLGIGGGRGFVNQSAVAQELLGGDLGSAKGITTRATAQTMMPQRRKELLTAAKTIEMNSRFQGGSQKQASIAQARELRSLANDPARLMESMTQQAADFFNVDTLRDGVAGGLDNSQVGKAWLSALPAQARADSLQPFQRGARVREIRAAEDEAQKRQAEAGVEGSIKHFTDQLETLAKEMKKAIDKVAGIEEEGSSRGFIPNFNINRKREMGQAGVSRAQTYQWNVPGFGPAFGNRIDESSPSALQMAVMSHPNPRFAGMSSRGFVPNFALEGLPHLKDPLQVRLVKQLHMKGLTGIQIEAVLRGDLKVPGVTLPEVTPTTPKRLGGWKPVKSGIGIKFEQNLPPLEAQAVRTASTTKAPPFIRTQNPNAGSWFDLSGEGKFASEIRSPAEIRAGVKALDVSKPVRTTLPLQREGVGTGRTKGPGERLSQLDKFKAREAARLKLEAGKEAQKPTPFVKEEPKVGKPKKTKLKLRTPAATATSGEVPRTIYDPRTSPVIGGTKTHSTILEQPLGTAHKISGRGQTPALSGVDWVRMRDVSYGDPVEKGGKGGTSLRERLKIPAKGPKAGIPGLRFPGARRFSGTGGQTVMSSLFARKTRTGSAGNFGRGIQTQNVWGAGGKMATSSKLRYSGMRALGRVAIVAIPLIEMAMLQKGAQEKKEYLVGLLRDGKITPEQFHELFKKAIDGNIGDGHPLTAGMTSQEEDVRGSLGGTIGGVGAAMMVGMALSGTGIGAPLGLLLMAGAGMAGYMMGDQAGRSLIPKTDLTSEWAKDDMHLGGARTASTIKRVTKEHSGVSGALDKYFDKDVASRMDFANDKVSKNPHLKFLNAVNKKEGGKNTKLANFVENYEKQQKLIAARKIRDRIFDKNGNLKEGSEEAIRKIVGEKMLNKGRVRESMGKRQQELWQEKRTREVAALKEEPGKYKERVKLAIAQYVESQTGIKLGGNWDGGAMSLDAEINRLGGDSFRGTMGQIGGGGRGGYYLGEGGYSNLQGEGTGDIGMTPEQVRKQVEDRILDGGRGLSRRRGRTRAGQLMPSQRDRWVRNPEVQATLRHRRLQKRQDNLDRGALNEHKRKYGDWAPEMKDGKSARAFTDRRKAAQDEFYRMNRAGTLPAMFTAKEGVSTAARREAFIRTSLMKGSINEATKGWVKVPGSGSFVERGLIQPDSGFTPYSSIAGKKKKFNILGQEITVAMDKPITPEEMEAEYKLKEEISKEKREKALARYKEEQRQKRMAAESAALFGQMGMSGGFVPNFSAAAMELNNSYSRAATRVVGLKGIGLANTEETLGHHPRFTQPFVNPPEGSKEGMLHKMRSISRTGVNPYMIPNTSLSSQGSIPEIDTSGAQSSLGALSQEFDNLKTVLAQGGFIPDGSGSGTSTVTNNMSVYSNGGVTGGAVNDPVLAGQMAKVIKTLERAAPTREHWQRENMPTR